MTGLNINFDYIEDLGYESVGEEIVESRPMRLGYPLPDNAPENDPIKVPISLGGQAGMLWMHGAEGDEGTGNTGDSQSPGMFLNGGKYKLSKEELVWGSHIRVKPRDNGRSFIIAGLDDDADAEYKSGYNPRPQSSVNIGQFDNMLLKPSAQPDMRAIVGGGSCWWNGKAWLLVPIFTQDFTLEIPATLLMAKAFAIERDPARPLNEQVIYTEGIEYLASLTHQEAFNLGYLPQPSNAAIFYGWIKLTVGMTRIQHVINVIPATQVVTHDYIPLILSTPFVVQGNRQYVTGSVTIEDGGSITFSGDTGEVICAG